MFIKVLQTSWCEMQLAKHLCAPCQPDGMGLQLFSLAFIQIHARMPPATWMATAVQLAAFQS